MDILNFVFASIWHFIGVILLMGVFFDGVVAIIRALRGAEAQPVMSRWRKS